MDVPPGCRIEGTTFERCPTNFVGEITVPEGIKTIGWRACWNCRDITVARLPNGVTEIGDEAFCNCASLTDINIPDGVIRVGSGTFAECSELTNIHIPPSVTTVDGGAFADCEKLAYAIVPRGCTVSDTAFPPACKIFNSIFDYRAQLARKLANEMDGDGVDIVGMHSPLPEPSVDSRSGRDI